MNLKASNGERGAGIDSMRIGPPWWRELRLVSKGVAESRSGNKKLKEGSRKGAKTQRKEKTKSVSMELTITSGIRVNEILCAFA